MNKTVLKKKVKFFLRKYFFKDQPRDYFDGRHPFELDHTPVGYLRSFGQCHPDKTFYVIWRDCLGSGFFSNFTQVLSHIQRAEELGMIPVVDFKNFRTLYNVDEPVNGSYNPWEYYFHQVSPYTLDEVYQSRRVYFCSGTYPPGYGSADDAAGNRFAFDPSLGRAFAPERVAAGISGETESAFDRQKNAKKFMNAAVE